jgi:hypothetical protein
LDTTFAERNKRKILLFSLSKGRGTQDGTDSHDKNNAIASKQVNITFNNNK